MDINSYFILIAVTLMISTISFLIEIYEPCIKDLSDTNIVGLCVFRFIHYLCTIYINGYLCFFDYLGVDSILYLILSTCLTASWKILNCCIVSYYELKMYNVNHKDYLTNFHPCIYVLFRDYQETVMLIMGIAMAFTFYFIMLKNKIIPLHYKSFLGIIFTYYFWMNVFSRYNTTTLEYQTPL